MFAILLVLTAVVLVFGLIACAHLKEIARELSTIRQYLQANSSYEAISLPAQSVAYLQHIASHVARPERNGDP